MYRQATGNSFPKAAVYMLYFFTTYGSEFGDDPLAVKLRKQLAKMEEPPRTRKDFHLILLGEQPNDSVDPREPKAK